MKILKKYKSVKKELFILALLLKVDSSTTKLKIKLIALIGVIISLWAI